MNQRGIEKAEFPENNFCSYLVCENAHKWPLTLQILGCEGCGGAVITVKAENCPVCNNLFSEMRIRTDVTTPLMGIPQTCQNQRGRGISSYTTIKSSDWKDWRVLHFNNPTIEEDNDNIESKIYDCAKEKPIPPQGQDGPVEPERS